MGEDHNSVLGQMHICLDGVDSSFDGASERCHSILRMLGSVAPVGNGLWEPLAIYLFPSKSPTSYVSPSAACEHSVRSERTER